MPLTDLLAPQAVVPALSVNSKKQALQELSERAAIVSGLPAREIFDSLLQRERLGSTGVGDGIAIPHGKLAKCGRIFGVFGRLERLGFNQGQLRQAALEILHDEEWAPEPPAAAEGATGRTALGSRARRC